MAKQNAMLNRLNDIEFEANDAQDQFKKWISLHPDVIFVDPPRKGVSQSFIESCALMSPKKIVYISCNPATLARDLVLFKDYDYECDVVYPVDMFPQTAHVECVVLLERK